MEAEIRQLAVRIHHHQHLLIAFSFQLTAYFLDGKGFLPPHLFVHLSEALSIMKVLSWLILGGQSELDESFRDLAGHKLEYFLQVNVANVIDDPLDFYVVNVDA